MTVVASGGGEGGAGQRACARCHERPAPVGRGRVCKPCGNREAYARRVVRQREEALAQVDAELEALRRRWDEEERGCATA